MSHDIQASLAASELAILFQEGPGGCFAEPGRADEWAFYAYSEPRVTWPLTDGVIAAQRGNVQFDIALEFKRPNEGLHGVLTALGQAHAYLERGFAGAIILIPDAYESMATPGERLAAILKKTSRDQPIGVFTYQEPTLGVSRPFEGRIRRLRPVGVPPNTKPGRPTKADGRPITRRDCQWAHIREGSTEADAFFRYLQVAKRLQLDSPEPQPELPAGMLAAVQRAAPGADPVRHLSNAPGERFHDKVWRHFWFQFVLHPAALPIWSGREAGRYAVNDTPTRLRIADGSRRKLFFVGRKDSVKNEVVEELNAPGSVFTEEEAWDRYVENIAGRPPKSGRAHSYREDIDSGMEHIGMLDADGKPTDLGYRFVDACERNREVAWSGRPRSLFAAAILTEGNFRAFFHYVHASSARLFAPNPLAFSYSRVADRGETIGFDEEGYRDWLFEEMTERLRVMNKSERRGGDPRRAFQELAVLRHLGFLGGFRVGVGLEINWPEVHKALELDA